MYVVVVVMRSASTTIAIDCTLVSIDMVCPFQQPSWENVHEICIHITLQDTTRKDLITVHTHMFAWMDVRTHIHTQYTHMDAHAHTNRHVHSYKFLSLHQ